MKTITILAVSLALAACALPETSVNTKSPRAQLAVTGAPADAALVVDGLAMGPAAQFDGKPRVLIVGEGMHQVEIRRGDRAIHAERVFIGNGETRTLAINEGAR
jgi:hypothetical protein